MPSNPRSPVNLNSGPSLCRRVLLKRSVGRMAPQAPTDSWFLFAAKFFLQICRQTDRNSCKAARVGLSNQREAGNKMPLLFYFPYIIWMGMMQVVQDDMRVPVKIKARPPVRN